MPPLNRAGIKLRRAIELYIYLFNKIVQLIGFYFLLRYWRSDLVLKKRFKGPYEKVEVKDTDSNFNSETLIGLWYQSRLVCLDSPVEEQAILISSG